MTMHDTWRDVDTYCDRCGRHAEDPGHTTDVCSLGFQVKPSPQDLREVDPDPTGPAGTFGLGRCERCGESFRDDDEQCLGDGVAGLHISTSCDFRRTGVLVKGAGTEGAAIDAAYKHLGLKAYHDVSVTPGPGGRSHYVEFSWDYANCEACGNPEPMEHLG